MSSINDILLELDSDSSRLFKEATLKKHQNNNQLKQVISMALDPYRNFYIKKIPDYTHLNTELSLADALVLLDDLSNRVVTGHKAVQHLNTILSSVSDADAAVITKIIRRDLRCGVSTSTVNKVWDKLVPEYSCLLCSVYDQKIAKNINYPAYVQLKADGLRVNAIVCGGICTLYSRKGSGIYLKDDSLMNQFIKLAAGQDLVFDGELVGYSNGIMMPRKQGNGIANKAIKGTITEEESKLLNAVLWDVIPLADFKVGKCPIVYEDRFNLLQGRISAFYTDTESIVMDSLSGINQKITLIDNFEVNCFDEAEAIFNEYLGKKLEGVIIKNKKSLWSNTRSKEQIKLKAEKVCELRITGFNYGEAGTKNEFRLGSLLGESGDGLVATNISGFSDKERDELTPKNTIGRIMSVMYNERITKKKGGVDSLFLPRCVSFRDDKDVADTSDQIL